MLKSPLSSQNVSFLVKIERGFDENKSHRKKSHRKNAGLQKKTKFGYSVLHLKKPNFKTKNIHFKNLTMSKTITGGPFGNFEHPLCLQKIKKRGTLWDIKKFSSPTTPKGRSLIILKKMERRTVLLRNACEKICAYAPVRTSNLWG